jgi:flagellar basal-body rod protein FlgB
MSSNSIAGIFDALSSKMSYLNQKQSVLAENVANADTPGYKQVALQTFTFGEALKQANIGMTVTNPAHIVPASMAGVNAKTMVDKKATVQPNGNSVDVEGQMMEVSKTAVDYQAMTSIYRKVTALLKTAIKGNSG